MLALFRPWSLAATLVPFLTALAIVGDGVVWWRAIVALGAEHLCGFHGLRFGKPGHRKPGV